MSWGLENGWNSSYITEYRIFMSAYVRTAMLTWNRNLHEYLAFWS